MGTLAAKTSQWHPGHNSCIVNDMLASIEPNLCIVVINIGF